MKGSDSRALLPIRRLVMPPLRATLINTTIGLNLVQASLIRRLYGMNRLAQWLNRAPAECAPILLRHFGASIGTDCDIEWGLTIHNATNGFNNLAIGDSCHIGKEVLFDLRSSIQIGSCSTVSMRVNVITHLDMGHAWQGENRYQVYARPVTLGQQVYVGAGATLLPGVTLGDGCIVAAGAVVNHDIAARTVVGGVPAHLLRKL